jgi:hypothetical protein
MSLLAALKGAELVVADEELGLLFAWFGGAQIQVFDESGATRDSFSISKGFERALKPREVRAVIEAHRRELREEDES